MFPDFTPKQIASFWSRVARTDDDACWEWQGKRDRNYGVVTVYPNGKARSFRAHRVSYFLHHGSIPEGKLICHHCDNRACCNPSHLYAGSHSDNNHDTFNRGRKKGYLGTRFKGEDHPNRKHPERMARGSRCTQSKLTEAKVKELRERYANGERIEDLAREYGLHKNTPYDIINRKKWRHVL